MSLKAKLRLTIGTKLVGLIAILLMTSVASLVYLATRMFIEDNTALIQQMNLDTASGISLQARELFANLSEKMRVMGAALLQTSGRDGLKDQVNHEFFSDDKDFLAVYVLAHAADGSASVRASAASPELQASEDPGGSKAIASLLADKNFAAGQLARGEVETAVAKLPDGSPAVAVGVPFISVSPGHFSHSLVALLRQSRFVALVAQGDLTTTYLVDRRGRLVAHPDAPRSAIAESVADLEIVKQMLEGKISNGQTRFFDPRTGIFKLGAFHLVGFGGLGVITEIAEAKAFEAAQKVEYRSMLVAFIILCLSFLVGYLYSGTITWPIKQLAAAAQRISKGDFAINLKPKGRDEVADLSLTFNDMAKGLEERDRVKATFNKFHNKEIAEKLLSGEVKLGGERKMATIFFSDVRGFTGMSETMDPEQVVEMLNEYMTSMVAIIRANHGVVDKYVGDAIMALWGVPIPGPDDTYNAMKACLEMRMELAKLNEIRLARGQVALKIGMGLNSGQVIAGNIGSNEKMEYTVIGDTVNTASRMESMTKEYGTDLLVPRVIVDQVADRFIFEQRKSARVKGKTTALEVFTVRGTIDASGQQVVLETPYSTYASEKSDKAVHDPAEHDTAELSAQPPRENSIPRIQPATRKIVVPPPFRGKKAA